MFNNQSRIDKIIFAGIIGLLIFAPLAFGSVHVWAYTLVELGVFLLLLLWVLDRALFSAKEKIAWVKTPLNLIVILFFILVALQLLPLPSFMLAALSPQAHADKLQFWEVFSKAVFSENRLPLAYLYHPVGLQLLKLAAYAGMFFLVLNTVNTRRRMEILVYVLICLGLFEVLYGVYQLFSDTPRILWWSKRSNAVNRASGTYISANHFAGYLEMVIPLLLGYWIAQRRRSRRILSGFGGMRSAVQRWVALFSPESASPKMVFLFVTAVVLVLGLLLSGSRGGIISFGASMLLMAILFMTKRKYRKYGAFAIVFCLVAFSYGLHIGIDNTLKRFERVENLEHRLFITQTVFPMVADYKFTGVGLGNFKYLYPRYSPDDLNRVFSSGHAHNDWVEAAAETGLGGLILIIAGVLLYLYRMIRVWRNRHDLFALGIGAGVMAGLLSLCFHSYFDLNMHIPANPLTLAALLALGYGAMHHQGRGIKASFFYGTRGFLLTRARQIGLVLLALTVWAGGSFAAVRHFRAEAYCPTEWNSTLNLNWKPNYPEIRRAIEINPYHAGTYHKLALYYLRVMGEYAEAKLTDPSINIQLNEWTIKALENAVGLNPASEHYWYDLGKRYSFKSYDPYDYVNRWLPRAEDCFEQAVKYAPNDPNILFNVAWYWVWRSGLFSKKNGAGAPANGRVSQKEGIAKFQKLFKRSLALKPGRWKQAVERVWEYYPDDVVVLGILPDNNPKLKSRALKLIVHDKG